MFKCNGHIKEINDDNENQKDDYVKYDNVYFPWELFQPVDNSEGAQKLREIFNHLVCFPLFYHL